MRLTERDIAVIKAVDTLNYIAEESEIVEVLGSMGEYHPYTDYSVILSKLAEGGYLIPHSAGGASCFYEVSEAGYYILGIGGLEPRTLVPGPRVEDTGSSSEQEETDA